MCVLCAHVCECLHVHMCVTLSVHCVSEGMWTDQTLTIRMASSIASLPYLLSFALSLNLGLDLSWRLFGQHDPRICLPTYLHFHYVHKCLAQSMQLYGEYGFPKSSLQACKIITFLTELLKPCFFIFVCFVFRIPFKH